MGSRMGDSTPRGTGTEIEEVAEALLPSPFGQLRMVRPAPGRRPVVLVVEDDPADTDFIRWAFDECRGQVDLRFAEDAEEALDYLLRTKGRSESGTRLRPSLVLLDLRLPRGGGHQLLRILRDDVVLRTVPVVVLAGSDSEADIARSYELGANSYFTKPDSMDGFRNVIRIIEAYWLRKAELPPPLY
jgi:CheY-like chemotaxis protein